MLPQQLRDALRDAVSRALATHAADVRGGFGAVFLPHALARRDLHVLNRGPVGLHSPLDRACVPEWRDSVPP